MRSGPAGHRTGDWLGDCGGAGRPRRGVGFPDCHDGGAACGFLLYHGGGDGLRRRAGGKCGDFCNAAVLCDHLPVAVPVQELGNVLNKKSVFHRTPIENCIFGGMKRPKSIRRKGSINFLGVL